MAQLEAALAQHSAFSARAASLQRAQPAKVVTAPPVGQQANNVVELPGFSKVGRGAAGGEARKGGGSSGARAALRAGARTQWGSLVLLLTATPFWLLRLFGYDAASIGCKLPPEPVQGQRKPSQRHPAEAPPCLSLPALPQREAVLAAAQRRLAQLEEAVQRAMADCDSTAAALAQAMQVGPVS